MRRIWRTFQEHLAALPASILTRLYPCSWNITKQRHKTVSPPGSVSLLFYLHAMAITDGPSRQPAACVRPIGPWSAPGVPHWAPTDLYHFSVNTPALRHGRRIVRFYCFPPNYVIKKNYKYGQVTFYLSTSNILRETHVVTIIKYSFINVSKRILSHLIALPHLSFIG